MILNPHASTASIFGAYYWAGSVYTCQATFFAWANDAMRWEEDSLRTVVIASMDCGSNAVNAWWSILFYSANFAPRFAVCCFSFFFRSYLLFVLDITTPANRMIRVINISNGFL